MASPRRPVVTPPAPAVRRRWWDEKTPDVEVESKAEENTRVPPTHALARRTKNAQPSTTQGTLAPHPRLTRDAPLGSNISSAKRLKRTDAFRVVYRRGRWAHGPTLSVGIATNHLAETRVGLRTRRGLKGAVERNRLKRQLRAAVYQHTLPLRGGLDVVIVIHPRTRLVGSASLESELKTLCKRVGALS